MGKTEHPAGQRKEIRKADMLPIASPSCRYRKLALKFHPEINKDEASTAEFNRMCEAYDVLSDRECPCQVAPATLHELSSFTMRVTLSAAMHASLAWCDVKSRVPCPALTCACPSLSHAMQPVQQEGPLWRGHGQRMAFLFSLQSPHPFPPALCSPEEGLLRPIWRRGT